MQRTSLLAIIVTSALLGIAACETVKTTSGGAVGVDRTQRMMVSNGNVTGLVERLVREHRVAAIPGTTFGLHDDCYLRVSYGALRPAEVEEGVGRLVQGLRAIVEG